MSFQTWYEKWLHIISFFHLDICHVNCRTFSLMTKELLHSKVSHSWHLLDHAHLRFPEQPSSDCTCQQKNIIHHCSIFVGNALLKLVWIPLSILFLFGGLRLAEERGFLKKHSNWFCCTCLVYSQKENFKTKALQIHFFNSYRVLVGVWFLLEDVKMSFFSSIC